MAALQDHYTRLHLLVRGQDAVGYLNGCVIADTRNAKLGNGSLIGVTHDV